jgi:energy-coupling factor transport system permease protein
MNGLVPVYRRTGSALHSVRPGVAVGYLSLPCAFALAFDHPLALAAALAAVLAVAVASGVGAEVRRASVLAAPLALLVAVVNPLVSQQGLTVLAIGPSIPVLGPIDLTLEELLYGAVFALRVMVVCLTFALYSATVDPDAVLALFRRLSFRSALAASIATRLVPALGRDAERLSVAYGLRAAAPIDAGRLQRLRQAALLARALAAGSLERAVDLAAALEVRGYACGKPASVRRRTPWSRHDLTFALTAACSVALLLVALVSGIAPFDPYPRLRLGLGPEEIALSLALPAAMLAPFRRGGAVSRAESCRA